MRKGIIVAVAGLLALWAIVVAIQSHGRDPEMSNPADLAYEEAGRRPGVGARFDGDAPEFFVSDSALLMKTDHEIRGQMTDQATGRGIVDAPYFVEIADGRYAFGYADGEGRTRPVFTQKDQKHTIFWYDDAWERWEKRRREPDAGGLSGNPGAQADR